MPPVAGAFRAFAVSVAEVPYAGKDHRKVVLIGGPCAVEDAEQILAAARAVRAAGAAMLRGGAWKPRTSPYDFQGLGERGLELLREAATLAEDEGFARVEADVPLAEMFGYATDLRSATQGRATYSMEFEKYAEAPANVADAVLRKAS